MKPYQAIGPQLAKATAAKHELGSLIADFVTRYGPNKPGSQMLASLMDYLRIRNLALEQVGGDELIRAVLTSQGLQEV